MKNIITKTYDDNYQKSCLSKSEFEFTFLFCFLFVNLIVSKTRPENKDTGFVL